MSLLIKLNARAIKIIVVIVLVFVGIPALVLFDDTLKSNALVSENPISDGSHGGGPLHALNSTPLPTPFPKSTLSASPSPEIPLSENTPQNDSLVVFSTQKGNV